MGTYYPLTAGDSVKITDGTDTLQITTAGEAQALDFLRNLIKNGTRVIDYKSGGAESTQYTVPSGKIFVLLNVTTSSSGSPNLFRIKTGATVNFYFSDAGTNGFSTNGPITCIYGQTITCQGYVSFFGYEIDATAL